MLCSLQKIGARRFELVRTGETVSYNVSQSFPVSSGQKPVGRSATSTRLLTAPVQKTMTTNHCPLFCPS